MRIVDVRTVVRGSAVAIGALAILGCSGLGIEIPGLEAVTGEEEATEEAEEEAPAEGDKAEEPKDTGDKTKAPALPEAFSGWAGLPLAGATLVASGPDRVSFEHSVGRPVEMVRLYIDVAVANGWNRPDPRMDVDRVNKEVTLDRGADAKKVVMKWSMPAADGKFTVELILQ